MATRPLTKPKTLPLAQADLPSSKILKGPITMDLLTPEAGQQTQRGILVGMTRYGKSTLLAAIIRHFSAMNKGNRKGCRVLVVDTKPRWRGTKVVSGPHPSQRYRRFVKGDTLTSFVLSNASDWAIAWTPKHNPTGIVIAQRLDLEERALVQWQLTIIRRFFRTQRPTQPSLLVIDEGMDFFGANGTAYYSNIIQRCWRAGGEQGMACLMGVQRPRGINLQMLTESQLLYLFHIAYDDDLKRLTEMGFPRGIQSPDEDQRHKFIYMRTGKVYPKLVHLQLKKG